MTSKIYDRGTEMDSLTLADLIQGADHLAHLIQEQQGELEHYVRQIPNSRHPTI